jgi:hypothetical protein
MSAQLMQARSSGNEEGDHLKRYELFFCINKLLNVVNYHERNPGLCDSRIVIAVSSTTIDSGF